MILFLGVSVVSRIAVLQIIALILQLQQRQPLRPLGQPKPPSLQGQLKPLLHQALRNLLRKEYLLT